MPLPHVQNFPYETRRKMVYSPTNRIGTTKRQCVPANHKRYHQCLLFQNRHQLLSIRYSLL